MVGILAQEHGVLVACRRFCLPRKRFSISTVLAGERLGIVKIDEVMWLVSLMHVDFGSIDLEQRTLQIFDNLLGPMLSPVSSVRTTNQMAGEESPDNASVARQAWAACS